MTCATEVAQLLAQYTVSCEKRVHLTKKSSRSLDLYLHIYTATLSEMVEELRLITDL